MSILPHATPAVNAVPRSRKQKHVLRFQCAADVGQRFVTFTRAESAWSLFEQIKAQPDTLFAELTCRTVGEPNHVLGYFAGCPDALVAFKAARASRKAGAQ